MSKNDHRRLEISSKMTGNVGIVVFTLLGIVIYLLAFSGIAFTTPKPMAFWKLLVGGIGGALFIGVITVAVLRFFRFFLLRESKGDSI